ncbi:MAG: TRAM domain-containing protein, partial [Verrucomicrobia bacterium]|nr:TRAM domain-containing protein [Verrucomicrobiota bacterium]
MITIADIEDIAFGGDGVARIDGKATFIPFTIDGERVEAKLTQNKKSFARGKVLSHLIASPHRVNPKCKWFGQCGGCQYQHISYEHQLAVKEKQLTDTLVRIAKIENPPVEPIVPSPKPYGYRNKMTLHGPGKPGFLALDNKTLLPVERCPLVTDIINNTLSRILAENPHVDGDLTIRSGTEWTVWTYVDKQDSALQPERIAGLNLLVPSTSFFQVNPEVTELLIQRVRTECSELEADHLIDAYCGMGLFAL